MNPDEVVNFIVDFAADCPGGESYWLDFEGELHSADMGYVLEYLKDLRQYIISVGGFEEFAKKARHVMKQN